MNGRRSRVRPARTHLRSRTRPQCKSLLIPLSYGASIWTPAICFPSVQLSPPNMSLNIDVLGIFAKSRANLTLRALSLHRNGYTCGRGYACVDFANSLAPNANGPHFETPLSGDTHMVYLICTSACLHGRPCKVDPARSTLQGRHCTVIVSACVRFSFFLGLDVVLSFAIRPREDTRKTARSLLQCRRSTVAVSACARFYTIVYDTVP